MKKLHRIVVVCMSCLALGLTSEAQKPAKVKRLDSAQAKEIIRERLKEIKKEKMRLKPGGTTPAGKGKKTTSSDQHVSGSFMSEAEVSLAVHPNDGQKLVLSYMEQDQTLEFPVFYSNDGGNSWNQSAFSPLGELMNTNHVPMGGGDPVFAWDKNGRVYFSWLYVAAKFPQLDTGFALTMWAYSDDNGQNWQMAPGDDAIICKGALDMGGGSMFPNYPGFADRQWLAVDNSGGANQGTLYCSSFFVPGDEDPSKMGVLVQTKTPSTTKFNNGVLVYNGSTQFANVEVDKGGTLHVSFADLFAEEILHASSSDAGQSFTATHLVGSGSNLMGGMNMIHDRENAATNLAIASDNSLHVVWGDFTSSANGYYSRSTDGGNSWSTPIDLKAKYGFKHVFMPTVAGDNGVAVFFYGTKGDDSTNYYHVSSDNGTTFSAASRVSSVGTDYGGYSPADFFGDYNRTVRKDKTNYAAWTDGRMGDGPKVYFAKTQSYPDNIKEITSVNSSLSILSVYPNPARNEITLELQATETGDITIQIQDIAGKMLQMTSKKVGIGKQSISLNISSIPVGNHVIAVSSRDGLIASRVLSKTE